MLSKYNPRWLLSGLLACSFSSVFAFQNLSQTHPSQLEKMMVDRHITAAEALGDKRFGGMFPAAAKRIAHAPNQLLLAFEPLNAKTRWSAAQTADLQKRLAQAVTASPFTKTRNARYKAVHQPLLNTLSVQDIDLGSFLMTRAAKSKRAFPTRPTPAGVDAVLTKMIVYTDGNMPLIDHLRRLRANPEFPQLGLRLTLIEPNKRFQTTAEAPNDPRFEEQWSLKNTGQFGGSEGADLDVLQAWDHATGAGVTVAVIDTGVDYLHEDLAANIAVNTGEIPNNGVDDDGNGYIDDYYGWDFVSDASYCAEDEDCDQWDNDPMDIQGHGTHVSGIIAATTGNGLGMAGIAPDSRILPIRAGYKTPDGHGSLNDSDISAALVYALEQGADVVNMSFGGYGRAGFEAEIALLHYYGVVLVAAAGNDAQEDVISPANMPETICVSATDDRDSLAGFSNFGAVVDVGAPGSSILSTYPNNQYQYLSGTSMAAPHVAGVVALMKSSGNDWDAETIRNVLKATAHDVITPQWDRFTGNGRIDATTALEYNGASDMSVFLHTPERTATAVGMIEVTASVSTNGLPQFHLSATDNPELGNWTSLCSGTAPVDGDMVCAFDSTLFPDGNLYLRLSINPDDSSSIDLVRRVTLENVTTTFPGENETLRLGDVIAFRGGSSFVPSSVALEWREASDSEWRQSGSLPGDSDGVLARWDTAGLTEGFHQVRLGLHHPDGHTVYQEMGPFYLDPTLLPGWPISIPVDRSEAGDWNYWPGYLYPVMGDLDADGDAEVLVSFAGNPARLLVFDHHGELLWRQDFQGPMAGLNVARPVLADIDGDGDLEVFVHDGPPDYSGEGPYLGHIMGFDHAGQSLPGWPYQFEVEPWTVYLSAADVDLDCRDEILVKTESGLSHDFALVLDGAANTLMNLSFNPNLSSVYGNAPHPLAANLDEDPQLEIVLVVGDYQTSQRRLEVYDLDGTPLAGWVPPVAEQFWYSPCAADVDGDGIEEIIVTDNQLHVFDVTGSEKPGFPISHPSNQIISNPVLLDMSGDGLPDIIAPPRLIYEGWHVYDGFGNRVDGLGFFGAIISPEGVTLADVSGDGELDFVSASFDGEATQQAWHLDGRPVHGFPKRARGAFSQPQMVDLNGDGLLNMVNPNNGFFSDYLSLYAYDTNALLTPDIETWPVFRRDNRRSGRPVDGPSMTATPYDQWPQLTIQDLIVLENERCPL